LPIYIIFSETSVSEIEEKFREFVNRKDIAILLINQNVSISKTIWNMKLFTAIG